MAAFPLPAGHPFASVRPGYAGFESTPAGSIINATASYVGASGDYPANAITLQLFATQGGTWTVGTPSGLTIQTSPTVNQAYTTAVYTGGLRGQTYTFTSISLTPAQGATLGWTGTAPSVTLTVPPNTTSIASGYYVGGNAGAIYLTPVLDPTLTQIVQGITDYFFVCTTSAAYVSVDSISSATIPFPTGASFTAGTTTSLDFTVQCRSNGILGQQSSTFRIGIVQPAVPTLTGAIVGNNVNLTFLDSTPGCTFDLSYGGTIASSGITSPYSYTTTSPGAYTFQVRASLSGLTTFSAPSTTTNYPAQPVGVTYTISGLSISLGWTGLGIGYTYNVSGTGLTTQTISVPAIQYTNLAVGSLTFYIQSVYGGITSTTCNVQISIPTTPPYNFQGAASGSTITLSWANDTPGATFTLSSSSSSTTLATQFGLTTSNYTYTGVPGGSYSFTVFSTSAGIPSSSATIGGLVTLTAPYNFAVTTLGTTASLTWQEATVGASFNISYSAIGLTLSSKTVAAGATSTSILGLPDGQYTFDIQSLVTGGSSSFVTATATVVAAPTSFTATSLGTTISLSCIETTGGCTFTVTQPTLGTQTTTASNVQYTGATPGVYYQFTVIPSKTAAFVGPSNTTQLTVLAIPVPTAVLSGTNVTVSWPAVTGNIAGVTYTVSSSPGVANPPTQPGTALSTTFVSPPPGNYTFSVVAYDSLGNVSVKGTTSGSLSVPVPQPTNVGATMTTSSQITMTWTETLSGCTFTFSGGPATTASSITNIGTSYTGLFNNPSPTTGYTIAVIAASGGVSSIESVGVAVYTFAPFNVTLSATCSQTGSTNNVTAAYSMSSPAAVYGPGATGANPYVANVGYSGANLTPAITSATSTLAGDYRCGFYGSANVITNTVPSTFNQFVVPPTSLAVTASGTNLLVKWADSTTAGCRYTVSGTPGTFTSNVAAGTASTGITFTGAAVGTAYTFIITASSTGSYTASRNYQSTAGGLVTTENATIPYTITSVSVPSTAVTPINYPATFTATATGTTIAINWGAVTGATGYTVYNSGSSLFTTTTATTCNYTGMAGTTYTLTVQATGSFVSNTNPNSITVTPVATPVITSITQTGSNIAVTATGTTLSINTPSGLSAPSGTSTFNFTGASGNTPYSFTVTATGTGATSTATSTFTTLGTPAITSATAQGTATITVIWTYAGPNVSGFTVYSNSVSTTSVGPAIRTATFAQSATTNNADTVYVVANGTVGSSIQSASLTVSDLVTAPTLTSSTVNALSFTVQWSYLTTARALSDFQVCNSTRTTLYSTTSYVANQFNYNSLFNVPSIAAYSFVVVGRDSVGSTISSAASTSVTPVAAPTITSVVQTGGTITLAATGSALSTPTVSPTLTTVSTVSPWTFTGAAGNTPYTFTVQANGTGASNTTTCNITTLATPGVPTVSSSGTTVTVGMPSYSSLASFSVYNNPTTATQYTAPLNTILTVLGGATGSTLTVTVIGGGGGGKQYGGTSTGGAGGVATFTFTGVTLGSTISYFVGGGGSASYNAGNGGYNSYVTIGNTTVYAGGGGGGGVGPPSGSGGNGIGQGGGTGGGQGGAAGQNGGPGSISPLPVTAGTPISGYGFGGTGDGGNGGNGIVVITSQTTPTLIATVPVGGTSTTFTGVVGTTYTLTVDASISLNRSIPSILSTAASITPPAPPTISSTVQNGGTITVTCASPASGVSLSIPNAPTPAGLTAGTATATAFPYTGYTAGTAYTFTVQSKSGTASNVASSTITALYTPGTPAVTAAGTAVTITWTYGPNGTTTTGLKFNVSDANGNWAGTTVSGALTTSFTGVAATNYAIYVNTSGAAGLSLNSSSSTITPIGTPTLTQNYQLTTQTKIVGTAAATGATSYSGTTDSTSALSAAGASGATLTWTGATGGSAYTGVTILAAADTATRSLTNQSLYSAFDPKSISACVLWLDAADATTVTGTTSVTAWTDKSGQGYNMVNGGTGTTTYTTYGPGPSIKLNTSYLYVNKAVNLTQFTVFSVLLSQTAVGNQPTVTGRPSTSSSYGSTDGFGLYVDADYPRLRFYTNNIIYDSTSSSSGNSQGLILSTYTATSAGALSSWFNGLAKSTATSGARSGTGQGFSIGGEWNGSAYVSQTGTGSVANVYEVIVFNTVLTTTQRQAIEGYLAWKWGLQGSLSSTNPYSTAASPAATAPPLAITAPTSVNYLVVGGGGGGGSRFGGGGGAGGFLEGTSFAVAKGTAYTVTVGAGGAGGASSGSTGTNGASAGGDGGSSVFSTITAAGGGGGARGDTGNGRTGGSGGGAAGRFSGTGGSGTTGQGFAGGTTNSGLSFIGGGGGGAGGAASSITAGTGKVSSITGTTYAGGGGGGGTADATYGGAKNGAAGGAGGGGAGGGYTGTGIPATAGTANTGGGGGGGAYNTTGSYAGNNQPGAAGGSGVVIVSYSSTFNTLATIDSGLTYTVDVVGTQIVYTFTAGSGTISW